MRVMPYLNTTSACSVYLLFCPCVMFTSWLSSSCRPNRFRFRSSFVFSRVRNFDTFFADETCASFLRRFDVGIDGTGTRRRHVTRLTRAAFLTWFWCWRIFTTRWLVFTTRRRIFTVWWGSFWSDRATSEKVKQTMKLFPTLKLVLIPKILLYLCLFQDCYAGYCKNPNFLFDA